MVIADGHVHVHDCFTIGRFLEAAVANFDRRLAAASQGGASTGLLLLTEAAGADWFRRLADRGSADGWTLRRSEDSALTAARGAQRVHLVAGRQIITAEGLEVLALATPGSFPDGRPLELTVAKVREAGAVAVVPWGFGKWSGARGRVLARFLDSWEGTGLFLGDNGNRPAFLGTPQPLASAAKRGLGVLPGSDPLPFPREVSRAGSFGFQLDAEVSDESPALDLRAVLLGGGGVTPYGELERPLRFLSNQWAMQVEKRRRTQGGKRT